MIDSNLYKLHPSAVVDEGADIGEGTAIWHFSHICAGAVVGKNCSVGQNVLIAENAIVGNCVKIQNNVAIYGGVTVEDDVFLGPSCVLTNVTNPRSVSRKTLYEKTLIRRGATIGANATIIWHNAWSLLLYWSWGGSDKDAPDYGLTLVIPGNLLPESSRS